MKQLKISIIMLMVFTVITGLVYPVLITGIGKVLFTEKVNGSLILKNGSIIGSTLIGQKFEKPEFFQGRPSAVNYDAGGSGGSNFGPANKKFTDQVKTRAEQVRADFNVPSKTQLPSEFIFSSGSGLDPHISTGAAMLQAEKIALVRKVDKSLIENIIKSNAEKQMYFYGSSFVNVLKLNLALLDRGTAK